MKLLSIILFTITTIEAQVPFVSAVGNDFLQDLSVHYRLEEPNGSAIDSTDTGADLTENGGIFGTTGKVNDARIKDNSGDHFSHEFSDVFAPNGSAVPYTVSFWIKLGSLVNTQAVVGIYSPLGGFRIDFVDNTTDNWRYITEPVVGSGPDVLTFTPDFPIETNTWYFVCARYSGSTNGVNGTKRLLAATTSKPLDASQVVNQVEVPDTIYFFVGGAGETTFSSDLRLSAGSVLDEISIWHRELTDSEVTLLINGGRGYSYTWFTH